MKKTSRIIEEIRQTIIETKLATSKNIIGCSDEEIKTLEKLCGMKLPAIYKKFLSEFGHGAGKFLSDINVFKPDISSFNDGAKDILDWCDSTWTLPDNAFVFSTYQGEQFLFFELSDNDDPPIYRYQEHDKKPAKVCSRFSEWLEQCKDDIILLRDNK